MYALIVESPAKSKTIGKYLGTDFKILSSYGHVRALPTKKGSVDTENEFNMIYELTQQGVKVIPQIAKEIKKIKKLYLATDPDREGEAISWHLLESLKEKGALPKDVEVYRVTFNEITKSAVLNAIANPRQIDINLVNAQRLRQALDYLVGFTLSPLLWKKLPGSRSAGRVQSVALRILCDRENETDLFNPEEYWNITINLQNEFGKILPTQLIEAYSKRLEKTDIKNAEEVAVYIKDIAANKFIVHEIKQKTIKKKPPLPFITSSLQQFASTNFGFSAKKTMSIAQKLYEGIEIEGELSGLITYMRTDGIYISKDAIKDIRNFIKNNLEGRYLPKDEISYKKKVKNAQEAHESIRPADASLTPEKIKHFLNEEQFKLYNAIWRRTIASQMEDAIISSNSVSFISTDKKFITGASYSQVAFDGFYKIYTFSKQNSDNENIIKFFESIKKGDTLEIEKLDPKQHFTQPPPRYSEAGLIKKMEELGIGRPSTYAGIISVLQDRNYAAIHNKSFIPEGRGRVVCAFLLEFCKKYIEYNFTANLEDKLDDVAEGKLKLNEVLSEFWENFNKNVLDVEKIPFIETLSALNNALKDYKVVNSALKIGENCPKCSNGKITLNVSKFGIFLGCTSYPECNFIANNSDSTEIMEEFPKKITEEIYLHKGPYGLYLKYDGKNFSIPKNINVNDLTNELIEKIVKLPKILGKHSKDEGQIKLGIGPYGSYILYNKRYYTIKFEQIDSMTLEDAIEIIDNAPEKKSRTKAPVKVIKDESGKKEVEIYKGPYGYYINHNKKNLGLGKDTELELLTFEDIENIIKEKQKKTKKK